MTLQMGWKQGWTTLRSSFPDMLNILLYIETKYKWVNHCWLSPNEYLQARIQDFKLGGDLKIFLGGFRVKNHDFTH